MRWTLERKRQPTNRAAFGRAQRIAPDEDIAFEVEVSPRDSFCNLFYARIRVGGEIAVSYMYRLSYDLTPIALRRHVRIRNTKAFARIFRWRDIPRGQAEILKTLFFSAEKEEIYAQSSLRHVVAAAQAREFLRISNSLATEYAVDIERYVKGSLKRRLLTFYLCGKTGKSASFHWTEEPKLKRLRLPRTLI